MIVNTGMGWEAPHHKHLFDAICPGPTPYLITTQGHVDHVGGVALFREPGTRYVAQAMNPACQADDARIARFRTGTALLWFGQLGGLIGEFARRYPGAATGQDRPVPDLTFEQRLALRVGELELELHAAPGGETVDSCVVWLPQHRIAFVGNLFGPLFPHFPNFNTLRGDKYRFAEPYLANVAPRARARAAPADHGPPSPDRGRRAGRRRARAAARCGGVRARRDGRAHQRRAGRAPDHARGAAPGVAAGGSGLWEGELGRAHDLRELHGLVPAPRHERALRGRARSRARRPRRLAGAKVVLDRARGRLAAGEPVRALALAEAAAAAEPANRDAAQLLVEVHEALLAGGGDVNFWESGWLHHQIARWRAVSEGSGCGCVGHLDPAVVTEDQRDHAGHDITPGERGEAERSECRSRPRATRRGTGRRSRRDYRSS